MYTPDWPRNWDENGPALAKTTPPTSAQPGSGSGAANSSVPVHEDETVWLAQKQLAELSDSLVRDFRITAADGEQYATQRLRE